MRLSKYEKETIILTSEGDEIVSIYTLNASLKRRLAEYSKKYPELAKLIKWTAEGSVTYVLEKSRVSIRLLPPYSEERRRAAHALWKKYGINSNKNHAGKVYA